MNKKSYIAGLFLMICHLMHAQTGKHLNSAGGQAAIQFDSSTSIKQFEIKSLFNNYWENDGNFQSSFNGDYLFFSGDCGIYKDKGLTRIKNGDQILTSYGSTGSGYSDGGYYTNQIFQTGDNEWQKLHNFSFDSFVTSNYSYGPIKGISDLKVRYCNTGVCFDSINQFTFGMYKTIIKRDSNNASYVPTNGKNIKILPKDKMFYITDSKRIKDYTYRLVGLKNYDYYRGYLDTLKRRASTVYLYDFNTNGLTYLDSLQFKVQDYVPKADFDFAERISWNISGFISRNRDVLFVNVLVQTHFQNYRPYVRQLLLKVNVDPMTGKIIGLPSIVFDKHFEDYKSLGTAGTMYNLNIFSFGENKFSSNDSVLYLNLSEETFETGVPKSNIQKIIAWRFRSEPLDVKKVLYQNDTNTITLYDVGLNPYGGLTIYGDENPSLGNFNSIFIHYPNANNCWNAQPQKQSIVSDFTTFYIFYAPQSYQYDYLRVKDSIHYDNCGAYATIKNKSDVSTGVPHYTWYVSKDTKWTQWDTFNTRDLPPRFFKKSGKYLYKLHSTSFNGSGYSEWYIDTITIKIPSKPSLRFSVEDTVVCRYTALNFTANGTASDTLSNTYFWQFGDGKTSTFKNPQHIYTTAPGYYNLSVSYNNGYCDTTIVLKKYIRVVEAPKPGFNILQTRGCAPFDAQFTDTVKLNVKQKDYFFTDQKIWQNINITSPKFNYVFNKAGTYRAVQRLTGFTGCVIQTDSVFVMVAQGITKADTFHVINSTVENKKALVWWPKQAAAVKYVLYKNNNFYQQVTDTFFTDFVSYDQEATYTVMGFDSCGNVGTLGRIGKPIFLSGQMLGLNEASVLYFTPYQQWQGTDINYKIQKYSAGNWINIQQQKDTANYTDAQFREADALQACYRIEAHESKQVNIVSHSNEVCVPFVPTLFVPTAFSPNSDGINDVFDIVSFGIAHYTISVYNRWGELVFKGSDKQGWSGAGMQDGVYAVQLDYTTNSKIKLNQHFTLTLLR